MPDFNVTGFFVFCNVFCILKLVSQELRSKFDILVWVNSVAHRLLSYISVWWFAAGKVGGQGGIISCLAPSPQGNLYAAGSYSRSSEYDHCSVLVFKTYQYIHWKEFYFYRTLNLVVDKHHHLLLVVGLYYEPQGEAVFVFEGQQGGVTHIAFSPDGTKLFSGGRKVNNLMIAVIPISVDDMSDL